MNGVNVSGNGQGVTDERALYPRIVLDNLEGSQRAETELLSVIGELDAAMRGEAEASWKLSLAEKELEESVTERMVEIEAGAKYDEENPLYDLAVTSNAYKRRVKDIEANIRNDELADLVRHFEDMKREHFQEKTGLAIAEKSYRAALSLVDLYSARLRALA